jgi:hypothetical protein
LALLTASAQTGQPQPATAPPPPRDDLPDIKLPTAQPAPTPAPAPTVEDLLAQLEKLRKQKADLEKQEQAVVAKLHERLKDQGDRLNKLGVITPPPPPPEEKDFPDDSPRPQKK